MTWGLSGVAAPLLAAWPVLGFICPVTGAMTHCDVIRQADTAGQAGWTQQSGWTEQLAMGSTTLETVAAGFVGSREFETTYGDLDNAGFVTLLYQNVLGRDPDAAGLGG